MSKKEKRWFPELPGYVDVDVTIGGRVTEYKIPADEMAKLLEDWKKKHYPNAFRGGLENPIDLAIKQASGSATTPGDRVRHFRKKGGLTQVQLAEKAGTTQANIASVESGNRALGKELAGKLGKALGVDYRVFL